MHKRLFIFIVSLFSPLLAPTRGQIVIKLQGVVDFVDNPSHFLPNFEVGDTITDTFTIINPLLGWGPSDVVAFSDSAEVFTSTALSFPYRPSHAEIVRRLGSGGVYGLEFTSSGSLNIDEVLWSSDPFPLAGAWPEPSLALSTYDLKLFGGAFAGPYKATWTITSFEVVSPSPVPESSTFSLGAAAALALGVWRRRRRQ